MNETMPEEVDFDEWKQFDDRPSDDRAAGPARSVEIKGRCRECWGPVVGAKDGNDRWTRIQCRVCGRALNGEDAEHEAASMREEAERNLPLARVGQSSKYREDANFVLKLLPDMDRDKAQFDQRVAAREAEEPKWGWLGRRAFPKGTAGYLYAQARFFLSGLEDLPRAMSAIALSDFDFRTPSIVDVGAATAGNPVRVAATVAVMQRIPSERVLMARMGTAMVAGMAGSLACEVGIKALLMTRVDKAKRTHDLFDLYSALPADCRDRLEADFPAIASILERHRHAFGKWRYFEESVNEAAILALVNTERVHEQAKAARVIVDECVVAGLTFDAHVDSDFVLTANSGDEGCLERVGLGVTGGEAAIPWDQVLEVRLQAD